MDRKIRRGDMFYTSLPCGLGSEQGGRRPVLVVSNDVDNRFSHTVVVAVMTSRTESKVKMPTHCFVKRQQGLKCDSLVMLEQIRTLDKAYLDEYIGTLGEAVMRRVNRAIKISFGMGKI